MHRFCVSFSALPEQLVSRLTHASYFMIYETKGLSLEQVDELYTVISQARNSKSFEPQVQYQDVDPNTHRHMSLSEIGAEHARKRSVQHDETLTSEKL